MSIVDNEIFKSYLSDPSFQGVASHSKSHSLSSVEYVNRVERVWDQIASRADCEERDGRWI